MIPGGTPFSQLSSGVKTLWSVAPSCKMSIYDKNMQKGRLKQHTKTNSETGNHPKRVPGRQKRAPVMSERQPLCQRRSTNIEKMALLKPTGSIYARASVHVAGNWSLQCWPLIENFVRNTVLKEQVRGKPSSIGFLFAKVVKRGET